ncbi:hypothetical protein CPLU01_08002 [Colletotrichum plurivorum]|uniref:Tautomerase cis-CaaD-like domain-containing protein n=1 Tax=Colletotrichum plurivorum TaxID=2175906 RepID=A0A8H6KDJ7_9PEZI|nr:hypothetical protein CPLU01_08002 [Colletotrichum plurivorum]
MPFYEVFHSYPLSSEQRQSLASAITKLHCETFTTPSFFVHTRFNVQHASDGTYFMAGKPRLTNCNRITGVVRTSPARTKSDFDALAASIEAAWHDVVGQAQPENGGGTFHPEADSRRLLMVMFVPMVTIREGGMEIPEAGHEGSWLISQLPYIKKMADGGGVDDFGDLMKEINTREDLKHLLEM